jgi:hypothetical protein
VYIFEKKKTKKINRLLDIVGEHDNGSVVNLAIFSQNLGVGESAQ